MGFLTILLFILLLIYIGLSLMICIEFTQEIMDELRDERFNHPHPRVQKKRMFSC